MVSLCALVAGVYSIMDAQTGLPVDDIEVIKNFDARLMETQKVSLSPVLPGPDTAARRYTYDLTLDVPDIQYQPPQIRPLALRPEALPPMYRGLLRAGYGFPNQALGELSYLLLNRESGQLLIHGSHHSADKKDYYLQRFSNTNGSISGNYSVSRALVLEGDAGFRRTRYGFFGVREDDFFPYIDEFRTYQTLHASVGASNADRLAGEIEYHADIDFYVHKEDLGTKETGTTISLGGKKWIASRHPASVAFIADLSTLNDSEKRTMNNAYFRPSFTFHGNGFMAGAGVNIATNRDGTDFFPLADLSVKIAGHRIIAFARVDGDLRKNNFRVLSGINPYIHNLISDLRNTSQRNYYAGVKGQIDIFSYQAKAGMSTVNNLALYLPDVDDYRKFQPLYDDGRYYRIEGVVKARLLPELEAGFSVAKTIYDLDTEEEAWHLPSFSSSLFAQYSAIDQKLIVRGGLLIESGAPWRVDSQTAEKLKGMFDLSFSADYYINKNIGAFVQVNNIAGTKHERWQGYPVYGINGVAGVLVRI